jgi:hypothetical protein
MNFMLWPVSQSRPPVNQLKQVGAHDKGSSYAAKFNWSYGLRLFDGLLMGGD